VPMVTIQVRLVRKKVKKALDFVGAFHYNISKRYKQTEGRAAVATTNDNDIRHPEITLKLVGEDGNAFFIISRARQAMRRAGLPTAEIEEFSREATSGDYDNVLATCMKWFDVE